MDLKVPYSNVANKDEALKAVNGAITPEMLAKFKVNAEVVCTDNVVSAKGKGFDLKAVFEQDHCVVELNVGFLLKPLKGKILEGLQKQFTKII